jgi:prepilin-type N-terminal cleavage/methylation domain-containing protein
MTHARPQRPCIAYSRRTARRGFTLIEILVVITLTSTILGGIAVLLHGVWRTERSVSDHRTQMTVLFHVAELFRADTNAGELTAPAPEPGGPAVDQVALAYPNERILEYRAADAQIERIVRIRGAITHRDTFKLAANSSASWRLGAAEPRRLIMQIIRRPPDALADSSETKPEEAERAWRVEATLHRTHPLDTVSPSKEVTP